MNTGKINFTILNEVLNWIKSQKQDIKLQFIVKGNTYLGYIEDFSQFLNSNHIILFEAYDFFEYFIPNDSFMKSLKFIRINFEEKFIDLKMFRSL